MIDPKDLDQLCINTIRTLAIDAVQQANSGHPGTPMDAAPTVYCLWQRFLRYDPEDPDWPNRDRFVLSSGHASALLYSLIYLAGIKAANPTYEQVSRPAVTLDDLQAFRQAGSRCPGHPEYGWTSGVEATTGRSARGWRPASAWPSPSAGWRPLTTAPALSCSTTASMPCAATAA